jgi:hypothetical protein
MLGRCYMSSCIILAASFYNWSSLPARLLSSWFFLTRCSILWCLKSSNRITPKEYMSAA